MAPRPPDRSRMRALAHPLRLRMLSLLTGVDLSAAEVARELGTTQANASWHLRLLRDAGLLADAGEVPGPGGRARRYRYLAGPDLRSPTLGDDPEELRAGYRAMVGELVRREGQRDPVGPAQLTDAELWVDPVVWADTVHRVALASRDLHAAARPPRTPGTVRVSASAALFLMTAPAATSAAADPPADGGPPTCGPGRGDGSGETP